LNSRLKNAALVLSNSAAVEDSLVAAPLVAVVAWVDKAAPVEVSSHAAEVAPLAVLVVVLPRRHEHNAPRLRFLSPFLLCLS
jgi:hypothetical protein